MAPRGDRFALGRAASRDADGHSLPSDRSMQYCELQLVCKAHEDAASVILGAWWIDSVNPVFDAAQVNERANHAVVDRQSLVEPDGSTRLRFVMRCPKCENSPVLRQDTVDAALSALYEQGAVAKVVQHPV